MSWKELLANKNVTREAPSKAELDNLRSIVARSLKDVGVAGLSADARFVMAYDAARTLSLMIVRASGYRPRSVGGHYNTFLALEVAQRRWVASPCREAGRSHTASSTAIEAMNVSQATMFGDCCC